jgi:ribosomal protein L40E
LAKPAATIFGVLLFFIGFFLAATSYSTVQNLQSSLGQVGRFLDPNLQQQYQQAQSLLWGGTLLVTIGLLLVIGGMVADSGSKRSQYVTESETMPAEAKARGPRSRMVFCIFCGAKIPAKAQFCRECGKSQA